MIENIVADQGVYRIRPGIAGLVDLDMPTGETQTWIYTESNHSPEPDPVGANARHVFEELPFEVRSAINQHFASVFALPLMSREQHLVALRNSGGIVIAEIVPAQTTSFDHEPANTSRLRPR